MQHVFWRIEFGTGGHGYQVMTPDLSVVGIHDDAGNIVLTAGDYTTIDSGTEPHVGVAPPAWAGSL